MLYILIVIKFNCYLLSDPVKTYIYNRTWLPDVRVPWETGSPSIVKRGVGPWVCRPGQLCYAMLVRYCVFWIKIS